MTSPVMDVGRTRQPWAEVVAVLCIGVVPGLFQSLDVILLGTPGTPAYDERSSWYAIAAAFWVTIPVLYVIDCSGDGRARFGLRPVRPGMDLFFGAALYVATLAVYYVMAFVFAVLGLVPASGADAPGADGAAIAAGPTRAADWIVLVVACAGIGFVEELVFRGHLLTRLAELLRSRVLAVVISSAVFAACHLYQGTTATMMLFVDGLCLGTAFVLLRRLWPLAFAHAVMDFVAYGRLL